MRLRSPFDNKKAEPKRFALGIDINDTRAQISFGPIGDTEPVTFSVRAGEEEYDIPAILSRRRGDVRFLYGKDALALTRNRQVDDGGIESADRLLSLAAEGGTRLMGDEEYDNIALLTLFVRRILSLLSMEMSLDQIASVMFTVRDNTPRVSDALIQAARVVLPEADEVECQSNEESLYRYMLCQPSELMNRDVLAIDYNYGEMAVYDMCTNHRTRPRVVTVDRHIRDDMALSEPIPADGAGRTEVFDRLDERLLQISEECLGGRIVSSVFLLGNAFRDGWMNRSLEYLCRTRRVFTGNNLFSKGACISAAVREPDRDHVLLDADKLRANIGMELIRQGERGYLALLDAGSNYRDAGRETDLILEYGDTLDIQVVPLTGGTPKEINIPLPQLPERPSRCTRLRLRADMLDRDTVRIRVTDMGFGQFYQATGAYREEIVRL